MRKWIRCLAYRTQPDNGGDRIREMFENYLVPPLQRNVEEPDFPASIAQLLATAARETYSDIAYPHLLNGERDLVNSAYFENAVLQLTMCKAPISLCA